MSVPTLEAVFVERRERLFVRGVGVLFGWCFAFVITLGVSAFSGSGGCARRCLWSIGACGGGEAQWCGVFVAFKEDLECVGECADGDSFDAFGVRGRCCRERDEAACKAEFGGFVEAFVELGDGSDFAAEADLSNESEVSREDALKKAGGDCSGESEVVGGFAQAESTDDVDEDILVVHLDTDAFSEDGEDHVEAIEIDAVGGAAGLAESALADEGLEFYKDTASTFHIDGDGGPAGVFVVS